MSDLERQLAEIMARDAVIWRQKSNRLYQIGNSNKRSKPTVDDELLERRPAHLTTILGMRCPKCGSRERYINSRHCAPCSRRYNALNKRRNRKRKPCASRTKSKH